MNDALKAYIDHENTHLKIFGFPELKYPTTESEKNELLERIECDLSPENLSCDGELPPHQVQNKARFLNEAKSILNNLQI